MPAMKRPAPRSLHAILNEIVERVNSDTQRLRVLEQSSDSITSRMNNTEQMFLQHKREFQKSFLDLTTEISTLSDRLVKTENTVKEVIDHVKKLVTESQLRELENLIEIYNPVKSNFVTKEELEKILQEKSRKQK